MDLSSENNVGHAFIAIDISKMMPADVYNKRIAQMADELKNAPLAEGSKRIFLPGEMEWEKREKALASGEIEITDAHAEGLKGLAEKAGTAINIF